MLQYRTVAEKTVGLLNRLMQTTELADFALAGGTSLALQLGHRESYDLDLFSRIEFSTDELFFFLEKNFEANLISKSRQILVAMIDDIKVDCVYHPYHYKHPLVEVEGFRLVHIEDVAAMKISAIAGRGRKRDFYDLYFLLQQFTLPQLLDFYAEKYGESSLFHALRSLTYFEDAEADADPVLFEKLDWITVKRRIAQAVAAV
ncbi:MAG: nucleotidyl transferase AbiEii/AbiGii toxin family protein [Saprospiraceae bacterium]